MSKNTCANCGKLKDRGSSVCATCYRATLVVRKYTCPQCGGEMTRRSKRCASCAGLRSGYTAICPQCNGVFRLTPALAKRGRTCCTIKCARRYFVRERNPNWKGGHWAARQRDYGTPEYKLFVRSVLERDGYTCQTCGHKGTTLEVHHIKSWGEFPELRHDPANGVTLCKECHNVTKRKTPRPNRVDTPPQVKPCIRCGGQRDKGAKKFCPACRKQVCCPVCGSTKCLHDARLGKLQNAQAF